MFIQRLNFNNPELRESESVCSFYYNHKSQKSTIRSIYGIYWDKKTINKVWNKLKLIKEKVHQKSKADYSFISNAIQNNQDEFILTYLKDEKFKKFYRNKDSIFPDDVFMEKMIDQCKFNLILEIIKDPCYIFNYDYIFDFIKKSLHAEHKFTESGNTISKEVSPPISKTFSCSMRRPKETEILINLIKYHLYPSEKPKVKIIGWYLATFEYYDIFKSLIKDNHFYEFEQGRFNYFSSNNDIKRYGNDKTIFYQTIEYCLKCRFEQLAIVFSEINNIFEEPNDIPNIAAETGNFEYLKYLWEKDTSLLPPNTPFRKPTSFGTKVTRFIPNFNIGNIIKIINVKTTNPTLKYAINTNLNKLLTWKNIEKDYSFIDSLFQNNCFEQIGILLTKWPHERLSKPDYFRTVIFQGECELILFFLKRSDCRYILTEPSIQEIIVKEYISSGEKLYYGAEMLLYIYKNKWRGELTKELCNSIMKTLKSKDILNCHSPILTCLLLVEHIEQIKDIAILEQSRCEKVEAQLIQFCKIIQESTTQESYIRYLMKQKDTKGRSSFQIVSEYSIFSLLETPEIGTIVNKMWEGNLNSNGLVVASSMHRYMIDHNKKPCDPFISFYKIDSKKIYLFQLSVWLNSCSLRFKPKGLFSVLKVVIYNLFIYLLNNEDQLLNAYEELKTHLKVLLNIYTILVASTFLDYIPKIIFCIKTNRNLFNSGGNWIDILSFIFALMIYIDPKHVTHRYHAHNLSSVVKYFIWDMQIAITKEVNVNCNEYSDSVAFIIRSVVLSCNDVLVWFRVSSILLTYKQMGPVIRMIFSMAYLLLKYLLVIGMFLMFCAVIFTAIFNTYSPQFTSIPISIITLFGGFLNDFNLTDFEDKMVGFGSVMFMVYVCITAVLIVNLLIAVLANSYEKISTAVDASNRAVLIQFYKQYKWDEKYGFLIFLASPFSVINFAVLPIFFLHRGDMVKFNLFVTRIYYILFYFPFFVLPFMIYTVVLIPLSYIKGMVIMIKYQSKLKVRAYTKILYILKWIFFGLFFLLFVYFRDIIYCFVVVFKDVDKRMSEYKMFKKNITEEEVIIFLKFIHSKINCQNKKDLHSLFMQYLEFENNEKLQMKGNLKKRRDYLKKLESGFGNNIKLKKRKLNNSKMILFEEGKNASFVYTHYIRKNLMIIEMLKNFAIDDNAQNIIVDIGKMRKLLPYTMNVEKHHLKRLVHSNMNVLYQVMAKMKNSKSNFVQYQLVNRIISKVQKLDKDIDSDIFRIQLIKNVEEKKKSKSKQSTKYTKHFIHNQTVSSHHSNHHIIIDKSKKDNVVYMKQYVNLIDEIKQNVTEVINTKKGYFGVSSSVRGSLTSFDFKSLGDASPTGKQIKNEAIWPNYSNK